MANIILDTDAGLTITGDIYNSAGAQVGTTVSMTDNGSGLYTGTFSLSGVADGAYTVRFLESGTKIGLGSLYVRGESEVTQDEFFDPNFDIVQSVSATTTNLDALTIADVETGSNQALLTYDPPTKGEMDAAISTAETNIIAEIDVNEAKIDAIPTSVPTAVQNADAVWSKVL